MSRLREWAHRFRGTLLPTRSDRDLEDELRLHIELATEDARRACKTPEYARRAAAIRSGGIAQAMDALRDQRGLRWLTDLPGDLRYACRVLARQPGFAATVLLSLAIGIGANTAIFSLINTVMLRLLPVRSPEELVELASRYPGEPRVNGFAWKYYEHFRDQNHVFSDLVGVSPWRFPVSDERGAEDLDGEYVVGLFFPALGVEPALGRLIGPQDDQEGGADPAVAVLSWSLWQRRFGLDPGILGKRIRVKGVPATVVGVTPQGFFGLQVGFRPDVWVPVALEAMIQQPSRRFDGSLGMKLLGRLKPRVSLDQARAEMTVLDQWRVEEISKRSRDPLWRQVKIEVVPAGSGFSVLRDAFAKPLLVLMAVAALLLLIAGTNVATLLLARGATRQRELALRLAIGAGRFRLVRQVLTECLLLSALGSAIGIALAHSGVRALVQILMSGRGMLGLERLDLQVQTDVHVLLFTVGAALSTGLWFGLTPAWQALTFVPASSLREIGGIGEQKPRRRLGNSLVVAQVTLSVVLLSAAGLFVRHLSNLRNVDLGFDRDGVLLMTLAPRGDGSDRGEVVGLYRDLVGRLEAIPGASSATLSAITPIEGPAASRFVQVEGHQEAPESRRRVALNWVGPKYFETLKTPWAAGRDFAALEIQPRVVIVNQAMARYYFGDSSALGKHLMLEGDDEAYEIVGVAGDAKYVSLYEPAPRTAYLSLFQASNLPTQIAIRTTVAPAKVARDALRLVDETLGTMRVAKVTTLADQVNASIVHERLIATLSGLFSALGAGLAAVGLYGLLAHTVARRTNEIGVRMALGATRGAVMRTVLRAALGLVGAGLVVGVPIAIGGRIFAASWIEGLPTDATSPVAIATAIMVGVALPAAYLPARRAARLEPTEALRHE